MAWTAPLTWVGDQTLTSTSLNTHLRDNLNMLAPALATTMSSFFAATAANTLAEFQCKSARIATSESTTSTTYVDLATAGPAVTLDTQEHAIVIIAAKTAMTVTDNACVMSWATSGATTNAASDTWCLLHEGMFASNDMSGCSIYRTQSLNPGSNTFTAKYRRGGASGSAFFDSRMICVLPL
jgi:hypothetical protein